MEAPADSAENVESGSEELLCDLCEEPIETGDRFRQLGLVFDADDSIRGQASCSLEHSYDLTACAECARRALEFFLPNPAERAPDESEAALVERAQYEHDVLEPAFAPTAVETPVFPECKQCHRRRYWQGMPQLVTWTCRGCGQFVCGDCALTIPGKRPLEYFEDTLCSVDCWRKCGCPSE